MVKIIKYKSNRKIYIVGQGYITNHHINMMIMNSVDFFVVYSDSDETDITNEVMANCLLSNIRNNKPMFAKLVYDRMSL